MANTSKLTEKKEPLTSDLAKACLELLKRTPITGTGEANTILILKNAIEKYIK